MYICIDPYVYPYTYIYIYIHTYHISANNPNISFIIEQISHPLPAIPALKECGTLGALPMLCVYQDPARVHAEMSPELFKIYNQTLSEKKQHI